ncbi:MAG: chloride channel protein [Oscillospiraceae bacterium]
MKCQRGQFNKIAEQPIILLKWIAFAGIIGLVVGGVSSGFYFAFNYVTMLFNTYSWILFLLPVGGISIVLLYKLCGVDKDRGTNFVLLAVRENAVLPLRTAPLVFVSTLITHLLGGSAGREGAILQIGGSISASIGRLMHLDDKDSRIITMCGMSAAFSALFGTPLAAAVFSMEIVSVGVMYYAAIVPCTLSAIVGVSLAKLLGVAPTAFVLSGVPEISLVVLLQVIAMGIACAVLSIAFCRLTHLAPKLYQRFLPNPILRVVVGGLIVIAFSTLFGTRDYNGGGTQIIAAAMAGNARPEAFFLKMLLTAITLGAGYKGGEIVPVFFTGATFGCVVAPLIGLSPTFGAAIGLVSVFCGVTNCPLTSILLAMEVFGGVSMPLFALACAVSYMLSGYYSLYTEQKIMYSKLRPVYVDKKAE